MSAPPKSGVLRKEVILRSEGLNAFGGNGLEMGVKITRQSTTTSQGSVGDAMLFFLMAECFGLALK